MNKLPLNQKLKLIGFRIGFSEKEASIAHLTPFDFDIEETLIQAIREAKNDFRLLGLLAIWIKIFGGSVILEKFFKKSAEYQLDEDDPMLNFLIATAVLEGHVKWKYWLKASSKHPIYPTDEAPLKSLISVRGKDPDFAKLGVIVPNGYLKTKESNILSPQELVQLNHQYRNRLLFGANWRADIITAIECGMKNAFQISKKIGCSYEPAHRISREYYLVHPELKRPPVSRSRDATA